MLPPPDAIRLARRWEGFRSAPYLCPAGVPTLGYGATRHPDGTPVKLTDAPITEVEAGTLLEFDLGRCCDAALRLCPVLATEPECRLAAIADFCLNLGVGRLKASTLRHYVNEERWAEAEGEFSKWVMAGGRKLAGLVARRADEAALFSTENAP